MIITGVMAVKSSGKIQLHFISSAKPPAGNDSEQLLINLQQCYDINRPSQHNTWSNKPITPLRDRLVAGLPRNARRRG